jgi:oxygen-independent coproporphyrinogen-3 oxidase
VSEIIPVASVVETKDEKEVGSYFVANYPPFSTWTADAVEREARPALDALPVPDVPLGMYLHIPFCRKRCHFCYFRVYTDKNANEIADYLDILVREWELYSQRPAIAGRPLLAAARRPRSPAVRDHTLDGRRGNHVRV